MGIKLSNNAVATLAANISNAATSITLAPGAGVLFPTLGAGDWCPATLINSLGEIEIVRVTARSGDTLTVTRAQELTSARAFNAGDRIELRVTAAVFDSINATVAALLPPGTGPIPWSLPTLPAGWDWADGGVLLASTPHQALRNAYIAAGFPHGQDGSGNPRKPDARGRVLAGLDNMGSGAAGRLSGATLGAGLGAQTHTLTAAEMPVHAHGVNDPTHAHSAAQDGHTHEVSGVATGRSGNGFYLSTAGGGFENRVPVFPNSTTTNSPTSSGASANGVYVYGAYTGISIQNAGSGGAHNNVQPTLVCGYIVKT